MCAVMATDRAAAMPSTGVDLTKYQVRIRICRHIRLEQRVAVSNLRGYHFGARPAIQADAGPAMLISFK